MRVAWPGVIFKLHLLALSFLSPDRPSFGDPWTAGGGLRHETIPGAFSWGPRPQLAFFKKKFFRGARVAQSTERLDFGSAVHGFKPYTGLRADNSEPGA